MASSRSLLMICRMVFILAWLGVGSMPVSYALSEMDDISLAQETGQGSLLVADRLTDAPNNMTFYRMMVDGNLALNANIDHMQLGCGGFNSGLGGSAANACDIDLDYVRLMGRGGGQPGAPGAGAAVTSDFVLVRPYLDIAIKNDGSASTREVVGVKIGAQTADGYFGVGQFDKTGTTNCASNPNQMGCHRGLNRISAYMKVHLTGDAYGCFGIFGCTSDPNPANQDHLASFDNYQTYQATRMQRIQASFTADGDAATIPFGINVTANVNESLRYVHGFILDASLPEYTADDFFLSFQRERVRYPNSKGKSNAFAPTANAGWWMNVPIVEATGLKLYGVNADAGALGGLNFQDVDLGQRPPDNCHGSLVFC